MPTSIGTVVGCFDQGHRRDNPSGVESRPRCRPMPDPNFPYTHKLESNLSPKPAENQGKRWYRTQNKARRAIKTLFSYLLCKQGVGGSLRLRSGQAAPPRPPSIPLENQGGAHRE